MNKIDLVCTIKNIKSDDGNKAKFLYKIIQIDGKPFHKKHALDMEELALSCRFSGEFEILTCGCGNAGCAGIDEGIHVTHKDGTIHWKVRNPVSWPGYKDLPKNIAYTEYLFDKQQYVEAIRSSVEKAKEALRYAEEERKIVETGPHGFTTYDFESLDIRSSGLCSPLVNKALEFSAKAHLTQMRKGTDIPYITHPFAVGMILANAGCAEELVISGILHDTVEDTEVTLEQIETEFGKAVADIVARCSEPDKQLSWQERKQHTLDVLKSAPEDVRIVARADKLHNISTIIEEHKRIGDKVWERFKAGKKEQSWYYHGLVDSLHYSGYEFGTVFLEFKSAVESIFGPHRYPRDTLNKIVSGGQTGVDRAALDIGDRIIYTTGGWCPSGRRAEDGRIPDRYPLNETKSKNYVTRTKWNVRDSDGTLILNLGELDGGTRETVEHARKINKPCLVVELDDNEHPQPDVVKNWLIENNIRKLNVAGPRESKRPGIYDMASEYLAELFTKCKVIESQHRLDNQ